MFNNKTFSMTGFGLASEHYSWGSLVIELRSVNSRFLELHFKMPDQWRGAEPVLRELLQQQLKRGKVECRLSSKAAQDRNQTDGLLASDLQKVANWQAQVQSTFATAKPLSVYEILKLAQSNDFSSYLAPASSDQSDSALQGGQLSVEQNQALLTTAQMALTALIESRQREGSALAQTLKQGLAQLRAIVDPLTEQMPKLIAAQQEKLSERLQLIFTTSGLVTTPSSDQSLTRNPASGATSAGAVTHLRANPVSSGASQATEVSQDEIMLRIRQEISALGLKADVAEELVRLKAHIAEFDRSLDAAGPHGKRLDFLIQELNREANTIGSKSLSLMSTHASLGLKQVIEQLREQIQNLE
jgi:uncharacterized protein (TIGR00255 family)